MLTLNSQPLGLSRNRQKMTDQTIQMLDAFSLDIPTQKICIRMGYKKSIDQISSAAKKSIQKAQSRADELIVPKANYRILDYSETNGHPIFAQAEKVALCICTIGLQLESESADLMKCGEMMSALILDAIGSEAVEHVARQADRAICEKARLMNLWPSKRYSPGYRSWDIKEQHFVFQMMPGKDIGVTLNESCMMIPRKSISFRINFYKSKALSTRMFR